jgi:cysteine-rich repeat protein
MAPFPRPEENHMMSSAAVLRGVLSSLALLPMAATGWTADERVVECATAILTIEADFAQGALALAPVLCKDPDQFNDRAARLVAATNEATARFNARYAHGGCDPDVALPLTARNATHVVLALQRVLGTGPLDRFCDGAADDDHLGSCGNDRAGPGEVCDGPDLNGQTCSSLRNGEGDLGCSPDCRSFDFSGCTGAPFCGNGRRELNEDCDDFGPSLFCDWDCSARSCGDGIVNPAAGEQCEDGNQASGDGCSSACTIERCATGP